VLAFTESCETALIEQCESKKEREHPYTGAQTVSPVCPTQFDSVRQFKVVPRTGRATTAVRP
jgi:hypothetical protein